jgi:hypothetical protein
MSRTARHRASRSHSVAALGVSLAVAGAALGVASPALAGKPASSNHTSGGSSTLNLVLLDSTDGLAHWGQRVTFDVATTATDEPHVDLTCRQDGDVVLGATTGFYDSYPWPWTRTMTLSSNAWTGGDADCTATLYYFNGRKTPILKTSSFHAYA